MKEAKNFNENEVKSLLLGFLIQIFDAQKFPKLEEIEEIHKHSIANKNFDLVSISMSLIGLINQKNNPEKYYKTLLALNDAKFLARSSNSNLALKINYLTQAHIEYTQKNFENALELLKMAQLTKTQDGLEIDEKIHDFAFKIQRISNQTQISKNAPVFSPENTSEDPLLALLKVGRTIAVETNIDILLKIIAQEIKLALNADRCTVFLLDEEKNELWSKVALGIESKEIRFSANQGIAGHVAKSGETININDVYTDDRFNKEIDIQTGYKTRNILTMPIMNVSHQIVGVFQVLNKKDGNFTQKDEDILLAIGSSAGIALDNACLFDRQQKLIQEQKELFSSFIDTLSASIDARDKITSGHSKRVTMYAELICDTLNLPKAQKDIIRQASLLHDIGKIGIRDSVLQKEGKLDPEEYTHIQEHVHLTHSILSRIYCANDFKDVPLIASSHHEKFDGSGYYQKFKGEEIPLGGRILAVSDVFDAITSRRHYRSRMKIERAVEILINDSDKHFDKKIVDAFLTVSTDKIMEVFLADTETKPSEGEKNILSKYNLLDIYTLITKKEQDNRVDSENKFMETFLRYYEERI